jgi:hypothetical protein
MPNNPSPLAGEGGARCEAVGGRGGAARLAALLGSGLQLSRTVEVFWAADAARPHTPTPFPQGERGFEVAL